MEEKRKPGRPLGTKKEPTVSYHRRINKKFVKKMDEHLKILKFKEANMNLYEMAQYIVFHENWDGKIKTPEELIKYSSAEEIKDMYDMIDNCEQFE